MYCVNLNVCVAVKTDDMMHPFHVSALNQKVRQFFFVNLFRGWWWCTQMSKTSVWISSVFWNAHWQLHMLGSTYWKCFHLLAPPV